MGFGQPSGGNNSFKPTPPARGSFPLDHDAECKEFMVKYLSCVKKNSLSTELCREYSINYLKCRMER
jgi:cytochrome c oxidase assembly protein subunit 19